MIGGTDGRRLIHYQSNISGVKSIINPNASTHHKKRAVADLNMEKLEKRSQSLLKGIQIHPL